MIFAIMLGGAVGAAARHYMAQAINGYLSPIFAGFFQSNPVVNNSIYAANFPLGVIFVNIIGSFLMGVMVSLFTLFYSPSIEFRAFITVGILGGFTTFSTFSLDVILLIERGQMVVAMLYILISVMGAITALFAGMALIRGFFI